MTLGTTSETTRVDGPLLRVVLLQEMSFPIYNDRLPYTLWTSLFLEIPGTIGLERLVTEPATTITYKRTLLKLTGPYIIVSNT